MKLSRWRTLQFVHDSSVPAISAGHWILLQTRVCSNISLSKTVRYDSSSFHPIEEEGKWGWQYCISLDVIINGDLRARTVHLTVSETPRQTETAEITANPNTWLQRFKNTSVPDFFKCFFLLNIASALRENVSTVGPSFSLGLKTNNESRRTKAAGVYIETTLKGSDKTIWSVLITWQSTEEVGDGHGMKYFKQ